MVIAFNDRERQREDLEQERVEIVPFFSGTLRDFVTEPPRIVPFSFGRDVFNEGEYAQISCIVSSGDLPLSITWSLQGSTSNAGGLETGVITSPMGQRANFLGIESVGHQHSGEYTCVARNQAGNATYSTNLVVNGN